MKKQIFEINSKQELSDIIENNKGILIVDFTSPTCPPCLMLEPVFEELAEKGYASIAKVNVLENQDLVSEFNISATPTLIIVKDNKIKKSLLGYQPLESWIKLIEEI